MVTLEHKATAQRYWNSICFDVNEEMAAHVGPFLTPVSRVLADDHGEHLGTGSYVETGDKRFLLTCEHVARAMEQHSIAHQFSGSANVHRCINPMVANPAPQDVALALIDAAVWAAFDHGAAAIPAARFAPTHSPAPRELLFVAGYAGARARFLYGTLVSPGTPYLTQEVPLPPEHGQPEYHFAVAYLPDRATSPEDRAQGLPPPPGLSGSLVWDTGFIASRASRIIWSPNLARVTGIVWGWPTGEGCLVATKAQHIGLQDLAAEAVAQAARREQALARLQPSKPPQP